MKTPKFIAHRGAKTLAPENTMPAFKLAVKHKVNWIELDVQLTIDDELIIFHDHTLERMIGKKKEITAMTKAEVLSLDIGSCFSNKFNGENIPTLEVYLDWMQANPKVYTNIESKTKANEDVKYEQKLTNLIYKMLAKYPALYKRILISSSSHIVLRSMLNHTRKIKTGMICGFKDWKIDFSEFIQFKLPLFKELGCSVLVINDDILTDARVITLKECCKRILIYSYTNFDLTRSLSLLEMGVNGLFIDDIKIAKQYKNKDTIAFLATGDEIVDGDIINTNTPTIAALFKNLGFDVTSHLVCIDDNIKLQQSLNFLLNHNNIVFTTGGLGPTEDDLTRDAIAFMADKELIFSEDSWQRIITRLSPRVGVDNISTNNRQQSFFPKGAIIFANTNGTADGCYLRFKYNGMLKHIFMLPGPPSECLPMVDKFVLPLLKTLIKKNKGSSYRWLIMGVSESLISNKLKQVADEYGQSIGYRADYPYIEIKLNTVLKLDQVGELIQGIEKIIAPFLVTNSNILASKQVTDIFAKNKISWKLIDLVTKGFILSSWSMPLRNDLDIDESCYLWIQVKGLENYWAGKKVITDQVSSLIKIKGTKQKKVVEYQAESTVPIKGKATLDYVCEWLSWQVLTVLKQELT